MRCIRNSYLLTKQGVFVQNYHRKFVLINVSPQTIDITVVCPRDFDTNRENATRRPRTRESPSYKLIVQDWENGTTAICWRAAGLRKKKSGTAVLQARGMTYRNKATGLVPSPWLDINTRGDSGGSQGWDSPVLARGIQEGTEPTSLGTFVNDSIKIYFTFVHLQFINDKTYAYFCAIVFVISISFQGSLTCWTLICLFFCHTHPCFSKANAFFYILIY